MIMSTIAIYQVVGTAELKAVIILALPSTAGWDHMKHIWAVTHAPPQHVQWASTVKRARRGRRQKMPTASLAPTRQNVDLTVGKKKLIQYTFLLEVPRRVTIVHGRRSLASEERATTT